MAKPRPRPNGLPMAPLATCLGEHGDSQVLQVRFRAEWNHGKRLPLPELGQ